jgi:ATP-binding cassette subfamily B protein
MRMNAGMPVERSENFGKAFGELARRMRAQGVAAYAVIVLALFSAFLNALGPRSLCHATDVIVRGVRGNGINRGDLVHALVLCIFLYAGAAAFAFSQSYLLAGVVHRTMNKLRSDVEDKINRLPLSHVDGQPRGDLLSRVTNDIDNITQSLQQTLSQLLTSTLSVIGVVTMMFVISPLLALIALVTIPLALTLVSQIAKRSRTRFIAQWRHTGELNAQIEEAFTGHTIVKAFGRQREAEARFRTTNEELHTSGFGAQFASGTIQPGMTLLGNINYVAIAVVGGLRVASGAMTIGEVQAFIQYSRQFTQPLTQVAAMVNVLQSGIASAERVFEFLDGPDETPNPEPTGRPAGPGRVEFRDVSFSYRPDTPLITHLSLVAEPGTTVAIVGPTGAGKTTLVNLLMRFYDVDSGAILLDGRDIATMPRDELRSQTGMVLQDTWLFGGTIRDNIAYGRFGATDEEIVEAAKEAYVDRFVHALPHGYDTVLDDEGSSVSAGERQLITIARAFLADPTILILDEATSSVDTRTEVLIQHAMAALRADRTCFVIAHRLSTIRDADIIVVMQNGQIVEQGSHEQLLAADGAYAALYQAQFAGAATEVE